MVIEDKMLNIDILSEASRVVDGNRRNDYGTPLQNHERTAKFWSAYLGRTLLPEDVCMLNILQKISRGMNSITHDTLVDIAGYARNIQILKQERYGNGAPFGYTSRAGLQKPLSVQDSPIQGASKAGAAQDKDTKDVCDPCCKPSKSDVRNACCEERPIPVSGYGSDREKVPQVSEVQTGWGIPPDWKPPIVVL